MINISILFLAVIIFLAFLLGVFLMAFVAASRQRGMIEKLFKLRETITQLGGKFEDMCFDERE